MGVFAIVKLFPTRKGEESDCRGSPNFFLSKSPYCSFVLFVAVQCSSLTSPQNGQVTVTGLGVGSTASYICNSGFSLSTPTTRVCGSDGIWTGSDPICSGMQFLDLLIFGKTWNETSSVFPKETGIKMNGITHAGIKGVIGDKNPQFFLFVHEFCSCTMPLLDKPIKWTSHSLWFECWLHC